MVSSITATTTGMPRKPIARRVAISRAREATEANMVLSAPNTAPIAMIEPTTMPMMRSCLAMPSDCRWKYSRVVVASTFSRGSAARVALNASKSRVPVSRATTLARLLPRRKLVATISASAHISDSIESPDSNTPTTSQGSLPRRTDLPTSRPANWRWVPVPTTSSRRPGWNWRPATSLMFGRTAQAIGPTPRRVTLPSSSPPRSGRLAATSSSAEASGRPSPSRAICGARSITVIASRSSTDISSAEEPPRSTIAVSSLPLLPTVWR